MAVPSSCALLRRSLSSVMASSSSPSASTSRLLSTSAATHRISLANKPAAPAIKTPSEFLTAIAQPHRGDLSSISNLLGEDASWDSLHGLDRIKLKKAGVAVKERRYFLWAREKFSQGAPPDAFAIDLKPKKITRGWGPRVQKGIRVRGRRRPGEK